MKGRQQDKAGGSSQTAGGPRDAGEQEGRSRVERRHIRHQLPTIGIPAVTTLTALEFNILKST